MDPNLFHVDWDRLSEVLVTVIVLAFLLERALAIIFENRLFVDSNLDRRGGKEIIAFAGAFFICWFWQFDAISIIILREKMSLPGELITAGVIAGGSKASVKLFHDLMNVKSSALREKENRKKQVAAIAGVPAGGLDVHVPACPVEAGKGKGK